jgi:hypothetical protein
VTRLRPRWLACLSRLLSRIAVALLDSLFEQPAVALDMIRPKVRLTISPFEFEFCSESFLNSSHPWRSNQVPVQNPVILTLI